MLINFDFILLDENEEKLKDVSSSKKVADAVLNPFFMSGDDGKKWDLSKKIRKNKQIEVDKEDLKFIKEAIKFKNVKEGAIFPIFRAQLIEAVELQELEQSRANKSKDDKPKTDK